MSNSLHITNPSSGMTSTPKSRPQPLFFFLMHSALLKIKKKKKKKAWHVPSGVIVKILGPVFILRPSRLMKLKPHLTCEVHHNAITKLTPGRRFQKCGLSNVHSRLFDQRERYNLFREKTWPDQTLNYTLQENAALPRSSLACFQTIKKLFLLLKYIVEVIAASHSYLLRCYPWNYSADKRICT